jgi:hypothetical protein
MYSGIDAFARPEGTQTDRRVLLVSLVNLQRRAFHGVTYEGVSVIAQMENATSIVGERAPAPGGLGAPIASTLGQLESCARAVAGLSPARKSRRVELEGTFDLTFFMCQFPQEIGEMDRVRNWRSKSKRACLFLLEAWPEIIDKRGASLRLLDRFDHVFVLNPNSIPAIRKYTSTPVTFLPTASDTLMLPEWMFAVDRQIDYLCIGRRRAAIHDALVRYCNDRRRFYIYDVMKDMTVADWAAARWHNAELAARSKYFLVWSPLKTLAATGGVVRDALSTRYFEGASAGAVMLGSYPRTEEYARLFDWPDAVIDLPEEPEELAPFLDALNADSGRLAAIGKANRLQALARHDWAHRWAEILDTLGMEPGPGLHARLHRLQGRLASEAWDTATWPGGPAVPAPLPPAAVANDAIAPGVLAARQASARPA